MGAVAGADRTGVTVGPAESFKTALLRLPDTPGTNTCPEAEVPRRG